jgi:hypothetical protein
MLQRSIFEPGKQAVLETYGAQLFDSEVVFSLLQLLQHIFDVEQTVDFVQIHRNWLLVFKIVHKWNKDKFRFRANFQFVGNCSISFGNFFENEFSLFDCEAVFEDFVEEQFVSMEEADVVIGYEAEIEDVLVGLDDSGQILRDFGNIVINPKFSIFDSDA